MGFSKELEEQARAISNLIDATIEQRLIANTAAMLTVQVRILAMLREKGLLTTGDIEALIREIELNAAAISKQAPCISKELAEMALNLRNSMLPQEGKPS